MFPTILRSLVDRRGLLPERLEEEGTVFRRIVVPLDGSPMAESILPHVRSLAADSPLEVVLLAVGPMPLPIGIADRQPVYPAHGWSGFRPGTYPDDELDPGIRTSAARHAPPVAYLDEVLADEKRELSQSLAEPAERLAAAGVRVRTQVRIGDPAVEIVRCAEDEGADAIAMSTHGRTGLDRLVHGSVAGTVLRSARLPVLLFRPGVRAFGHGPAREEAPEALVAGKR
jgi:nucleotide-binding universal stress UspA family protein